MNKSSKFQWGNIVVVSLAHLLHDVYSSFLAPLLPMLIDKLGMSLSGAGFLSVVGRLPSLLNPFIGLIADRIKIRYFIIFAPMVTATTMSLLPLAPDYTALVILLFIMGISAACFHVPGPVMIRHISGQRLGMGMSMYMIGGELARTLGPLVILGAVYLWGPGGTYWLIPFGAIATLMLFWRLHNIDISRDFHHTKKTSPPAKAFREALPVLMVLLGMSFFSGLMKSSLTTFLPTYLHTEGESIWMGGIYLAILQFSGVVGVFATGWISDHIGRKTTLLITTSVTPVLMLIFCTQDGILSIFILTIMGFFLFASGPVGLAIVQDIRSERPSFINGIYITVSFLTGAVAVTLVGVLGDHIGLEKTFRLSALLAFGAIPFVMFLPGTKRG